MFPTERRAASFYPEIPPSSLQCWAGNQDRNLIKASMHGMMEKGEWWRERWRGKEMEERELNDQQRCRETWDMAVFCFSGTACSLRFPHVQSKQARQTPVSSSERKREREVETERGMRETCRLSDTQSFYPLMCLMVPFDSKVYYRVLSPKPGPRMSVLTNWTWWLKRCRSGLTNSLGSVLQSLSCTPSTGYHPSFHHFSTVQTNGVLQWFSPLAVYLATLDSFIVADDARLFSSGGALQLCTDFYVMHWNHIYSCATYRSFYKKEKRHPDSKMETNILMFSLTLCPGTKATVSKEWRKSSTCCWPPPPVSACSNSNPRSLSASKLSCCLTLVRQHVRVCVLTVFVTFLWNIFRKNWDLTDSWKHWP